jgi:hypothetical protein
VQLKEVIAISAGVGAVIVGLIWRSLDLIAIGAGSVGLPEVLGRERDVMQETMITRGGNMFGKRKREAEAKIEDKRAEPGTRFQPETDTSVFLPEDGENQTATREEFVKNFGLDKP